MKKYFSNKQLAITALVLIALVLFAIQFVGMSAPAVSYAYDVDADGEIYYAGLGSGRTETETFTYTTKTVDSYSINTSFPNYYNTNDNLQNTCANVAGANLIGYYDRYFENLISNSVPGIGTSKYIYYPMTKNLVANQAVINDLHTRMQTNVNSDGCTQAQYKNGLSSYVQSKGLSITYTSVMTNGKFDLNKAKVQLQNGNPISLYLLGYGFTKITDDGSSVLFEKSIYDGNHIAVAYGYERVYYYGSNGSLIRSEIYLKVSTGLNGVSGVYVVNNYGKLYDAEAVNVK